MNEKLPLFGDLHDWSAEKVFPMFCRFWSENTPKEIRITNRVSPENKQHKSEQTKGKIGTNLCDHFPVTPTGGGIAANEDPSTSGGEGSANLMLHHCVLRPIVLA